MKFLDLISKYIIVPAAILYFSGWIYLYTLCSNVGLDVALLKLDTNTILLNSYNVLQFVFRFCIRELAVYWLVLVGLFSALLIALGATKRSRLIVLKGMARAHMATRDAEAFIAASFVVQALLYVFLIVAIGSISKSAAIAYLNQVPIRPGTRMAFEFNQLFVTESEAQCTADPQCWYTFLKAANGSARLRLLLETPDYFVVWAQPDSPQASKRAIGNVYLVKRDAVNFAMGLEINTKPTGENRQ